MASTTQTPGGRAFKGSGGFPTPGNKVTRDGIGFPTPGARGALAKLPRWHQSLPFMAQGVSSVPWYGHTVFPHAVYEPSLNQIWMVWAGWDDAAATRTVLLRVFNTLTKLWGPVITIDIGSNALVNDDHGNPSICRNADGFWNVFFGAHGTSCSVAGTWRADDPTTWRSVTTITGSLTYPHPTVINGKIYAVFREQSAVIVSFCAALCVHVGTPTGNGDASWGPQIELANFGADTRFYIGSNYPSGNNILIVGTQADGIDSYRQSVYFLSYNTVTGALSNIDGSHTVASGSFPVGAADLDAFYRIVAQTNFNLHIWMPAFCIDTNGNYHFIYCGPIPNTNNYGVFSKSYIGGVFTDPHLLDGTNQDGPDLSISPLSGGRVQAFWSHGPGPVFGPSDIWSAVRTKTSWGKPFVVRGQPGPLGQVLSLNGATAIFNETPGDAGSVIFCEAVNNAPSGVDPPGPLSSETLKGYFYYQGKIYGATQNYVGIGDLLGNCKGFWGLRALKYSAVGMNCVKLRRDSDNTTQTFTTLTGGDLDYNSIAAFGGAANLFVDTLYDQSGAGNNMVQANTAKQPKYIAAASGLGANRPAMQFSGSQSLAVTIPVIAQPWVNVAAAKRTGTFTTYGTILSGASATDGLYFNNATNQITIFSATQITLAASDNAWHAVAGTAHGSGISVLCIDSNATQGNLTSTGNHGGVCAMGDDGAGDPLTGFITEAGVFANHANPILAKQLNSNQHAYWGF